MTQADCLWITKLVLKCVMKGVRSEEDRERVFRNVEQLHTQLDGSKETSPRVRRAMRQIKEAAKAWEPPSSQPGLDGPVSFPGAQARPNSPENQVADAEKPRV
jgi:hypothetical protein